MDAEPLSSIIVLNDDATERKGRRSAKEQAMEEIEVLDLEHDCVCLTPISQSGSTVKTAISVEYHSEIKDQLALVASLTENQQSISQYHTVEEDDVKLLYHWNPNPTSCSTPFARPSITEPGQSSNSDPPRQFLCEICTEYQPGNESFNIKGCGHAYCKDCISKYVSSKLQDNISNIHCPVADCGGLLEPGYCRTIIPEEVFDRWGNALCEAVILAAEKFYCPFKDCSALLIDDNGGEEGVIIRESECPNCNRLFCAKCKVPWHAEIECEEFNKLNKDERESEDIMLVNLARNKSWKRCPRCGFYVEKTEGCMFMKCRCGALFCYKCGNETPRDHRCENCEG